MTPVKDDKVTAPSLSSGRAKLPISVERLVQWTYADQRAHVAPRGVGPSAGEGMFDRMDQLAELGWMIRGSSSVAHKLHDDAYLVHDVVSGMAPESAAQVMAHGFLRDRPDPRLGARHRLEPEWLYETQPDGITVLRVATVERISREVARRLRCPDDVNRYWVPVIQADRADEVRIDRERWTAWAEGLLLLHTSVQGRLIAHQLTDEVPISAPWA